MDRFIVLVKYGDTEFKRNLKSNMDRFIDCCQHRYFFAIGI